MTGFNPEQEGAVRPRETIVGSTRDLWNRAEKLLGRFGVEFKDKDSLDKEKEIIENIREIQNREEGEDNMFLDVNFEDKAGKEMSLRTVAQMDNNYERGRKIDYDKWDLTPQEEAERWLNREIIVGEKLGEYLSAEPVSADKLVKANRDPDQGEMFLLKEKMKSVKDFNEFGEDEGRALAKTLLRLQADSDATGMVGETMREEGIKTKLEMEQKIFEDYFDHFDGYMDNSEDMLGDLDNDKLASAIKEKMMTYKDTIESTQLTGDQYSLAHGGCNMDTMVYTEDGKMLLSDWKRAGTTQNKELSLVYDLGDVFNDAVDRFDDIQQAKSFMAGAEEEIGEYYKNNPDVAKAVIELTKLRSFSMIVNDMDGEKQEFVKQEMDNILNG